MEGSLKDRQAGFILASVLWGLAIMFVVVGIFHGFVHRKLEIGLAAKRSMQEALDQYSTEQAVLYVLGTSRMTLAGLSPSTVSLEQQSDESFSYTSPVGDEMLLDGSAYTGINSAQFSVQDLSGLLSLNSNNSLPIRTYLESLKLPSKVVDKLLDCYQDYMDENNLVRLDGAEAFEYRVAGKPVPTNDYYRSERELSRVLYWGEVLKQTYEKSSYDSHFAIRKFSFLNFNTMPEDLLKQFFGLRQEQAVALVSQRKTNPMRGVEDFGNRIGRPFDLDEEAFRIYPSNELRVKIWSKGGSQAKVISLQLTPSGEYGPWLVDYEYNFESIENNKQSLALSQFSVFGPSLVGRSSGN